MTGIAEGETYILIIERDDEPPMTGAVAPVKAPVTAAADIDSPQPLPLEAGAPPLCDSETGKDTVP